MYEPAPVINTFFFADKSTFTVSPKPKFPISSSLDLPSVYNLPVFFFISPVPPSTTLLSPANTPTDPRKHFKSMISPICFTYSPSNFAFTGISSSSLPLICAHPVNPGFTSFALYLSRSAVRIS